MQTFTRVSVKDPGIFNVLDPNEFEAPATATVLTCDHGSNFPSCVKCTIQSQALIAEHDRTNTPVKTAPAFH